MSGNFIYDSDNEWPRSKSVASDGVVETFKSRTPSVDSAQVSNSKPKQDIRSRLNNQGPEPSNCIGVFGLSRITTEDILRTTFEKFGTINSVKLISERFTKESLGYGFINYEDMNCASTAIKEANGMELDGKKIRVDYSKTKKAYTPTPGDYKGKLANRKNINRNEQYPNPRQSRRNYHERSRSRSPVRNGHMIKSFDRGYPSKRDTFSRHSPPRSEARRYSPKREDFRKMIPMRDETRRYSPMRDDYRGYEHSRNETRRNSPDRHDYRRDEAMRGDPRRFSEKKLDTRRYSPTRNDNRRYSPDRVQTRRFSPGRDEHRRYSPLRNETKGYQSNRDDVRRYSPMRNEAKSFVPKRDEFRRYSPDRNEPMRFSGKNDMRRNSPIRTEVKRSHAESYVKRYSNANSKRDSFENSFEKKSYPIRHSFNGAESRDYRENRR